MTDLRDRMADGVRAAMGEAWDDATEYVHLPAVAARHLLPIIAAHEAEVVGRILDRIDALHPKVAVYLLADECPCALDGDHDTQESEQGDLICLDCPTGDHICGDCHHSDGEPMDWPCPTRRLTAEIRGEIRHG